MTTRLSSALDLLWSFVNSRDEAFETHRRATQSIAAGAAFGQPTQQSLTAIFRETWWPRDAVFIDLGSGTGTVLFHVLVAKLASKAIGVELEDALVEEAVIRQRVIFSDQPRLGDISKAVTIKDNILRITTVKLTEWAAGRHLVLFAFDARFPDSLVDHIGGLVRTYLGPLTFITTHSPYRYNQADIRLPLRKLTQRLRIGRVGVTEQTHPTPIRVRGGQSENYPESEWLDIEEREAEADWENAKRAMASPVQIMQLEELEVYAM